ncbi:uncharacterized protein KY384_002826 [Bacidia gigantensis]|uniref:uncharacterized protein n=1 Tax=Bacidia gigantensis TaxID=2732470 RepID=UPI001D04F690|nr:uncharacterized protein KY384_002826 [Bacidia gigantensis]KAG8532948.1 hypothetical protein KY384_002826 [Bacidia gigantensis]
MASPNRALLLIFFYRKEGMSFEDFDAYWRDEHSKNALSIPIFKRNILRYEQIHVNPQARSQYITDGKSVSDYDGIVVLEAESEEKIKELFEDPEYLARLVPDEERFTEKKTFTMMPGWVCTVLDRERGIAV